jgi:hypothetical protein
MICFVSPAAILLPKMAGFDADMNQCDYARLECGDRPVQSFNPARALV